MAKKIQKKKNFDEIVKKLQKDVKGLAKRYEPVAKQTGKQLQKAMNAAGKDLEKMYKIAHGHFDVQLKHVQKEKVYHELGKYVAERLKSGKLKVTDLEKFKKKIDGLDAEEGKIMKKISSINAGGKETGKKS